MPEPALAVVYKLLPVDWTSTSKPVRTTKLRVGAGREREREREN